MASIKRLLRSFYRLLLPIVILVVLAFGGASIWLVQKSTIAPNSPYLIKPEKYGLLSTRGAKITDETWRNKDGSSSRGWLLRGAEGQPAVVLLHRYGADRSWVLNLGVKINEATNYTILLPDMRGHGESPLVAATTLGGSETEDVIASLDFLKGLKLENNAPLVGDSYGIYGVELGALAGLAAASKSTSVKVLALDSIPRDSDDLLGWIVGRRFPFASPVTSKIAEGGTYLYFYDGGFSRLSMCEAARMTSNRHVLLLAGNDTPGLQASTMEIADCFLNQSKIEKKTDLMSSGINIINASNEQSEIYDQRVIEFFKKSF